MIIIDEFLLCICGATLLTVLVLPVWIYKFCRRKHPPKFVSSIRDEVVPVITIIIVFLYILSVVFLIYPVRFNRDIDVNLSNENFLEYYNNIDSVCTKRNVTLIKNQEVVSGSLKAYRGIPYVDTTDDEMVMYQKQYTVEYNSYKISLIFSNEQKEYAQLSITGFKSVNELRNSMPVDFLCDLLNPILSFELDISDFDYLLSEDCYIGDIELEQTVMKDIIYIADYGLGDQVYMMVTREKNDELALYITGLTKASMFF